MIHILVKIFNKIETPLLCYNLQLVRFDVDQFVF